MTSLLERMYLWIALRTQRFENYPEYNRFLAGIHVLFWNRVCGPDWKHAFNLARIYWFGK